MSWMNDFSFYKRIAEEVKNKYKKIKQSTELTIIQIFIDGINNEHIKSKKDMRNKFKTVKKMVKDGSLKNIVNDLEFAIFGYNYDDNDDNKKSKPDNKTRTFAPSEKKGQISSKDQYFFNKHNGLNATYKDNFGNEHTISTDRIHNDYYDYLNDTLNPVEFLQRYEEFYREYNKFENNINKKRLLLIKKI